MNQSRFLVLICSLLIFSINNGDSYTGINWGRMATQRIVPSMVIDMILQNGIPEVKIFSASRNVMPAFTGTDIGLTVTIPNDDLKKVNSDEEAEKWIKEKLVPHVRLGVNLRYISVGTQPFSKMNFNKTYSEAAEVLGYMQIAIDRVFKGKGIKATMDHCTDVMNNATKPSEAEFNPEVMELMKRSTELLVKNNAPIWLDMFPIYSVKSLFNNDLEFAFFDNNSTSHFTDKGYTYTNIFEVAYDKFVCALEKAGFPGIKIIVGQVGWPTDGIEGANIKNAERYHKGLIKHISSGKGTPRRPGPIDVYLHNLADENNLTVIRGGYRGGFNRHWGIYKFDGKPKYKIDFSGKGRDIEPVYAKGVTHMPKRWCVFNNETSDRAMLERFVEKACNQTDCTNMEPGGSCGHLGFPRNISYAFNAFFQSKLQKLSDKGCDFEGLGLITPDDPSDGKCKFPIEIIAAEYAADTEGNMHLLSPVMTMFSMFIFFTLV